jgi:hypothetical protein
MACVQLYFLIYVSIASTQFGTEGLLEILRVSRERNALDQITGLLLYKDGMFMQLLEGPEDAVRATYGRIVRDERHRHPTVVIEGETAARDFADWSMAFHDLADETVRSTPGFSRFLDKDFRHSEWASNPSEARNLLRVFRRI